MENKDTNTYEKNECIKWAVEDAVKGHSPISKAHVMSVLTHCMAAGYEAPTPMVDANGVLGDIEAEDLKEGDTLRIEEEVRLQFDTMKNEAGVEYMPLFTDEEELGRGNTTNVRPHWDRLPLQFYYVLNYFLKVHGTLLQQKAQFLREILKLRLFCFAYFLAIMFRSWENCFYLNLWAFMIKC